MDYARNRKIKYDRAYHTLGKVTPLRVGIGVLLLLLCLIISGFFSEMCARGGHYILAEKILVFPQWMEKYKPEERAYLKAGVLYEQGELAEALEAFSSIEDYDSADVMESICALELARQQLISGNITEANNTAGRIDPEVLPEEYIEEFAELSSSLIPGN